MDTQTQATPLPLQEALTEAMVIGAHLAGGLSPERADVLLTVMLEHPRFAGQEEEALQEMLARACRDARPARLPVLAPLLQAEGITSTAFQLMFLVAAAQPPPPEALLLDAALTLGLSPDQARDIIAAGIPPELDILRASPLPEEVYLDVLLAAAAADGHLAAEELDALVAYAASRLELRLLPRSEIEDLMAASLQGFLDYGIQTWLEGLPLALPEPEQRQTAYRLAAEIITVDSTINPAEETFLRDLQATLGLS